MMTKMMTKNKFKKSSKNYRVLARRATKELRVWKKKHPHSQVKDAVRNIYNGYATVDFVYTEGTNEYGTHIWCHKWS